MLQPKKKYIQTYGKSRPSGEEYGDAALQPNRAFASKAASHGRSPSSGRPRRNVAVPPGFQADPQGARAKRGVPPGPSVKRQRVHWSTTPNANPGRRGSGVKYGDLDLTPRDKVVVTPTKAQPGILRTVIMGGNEEVGRNMTLLEYGDDIILIDMGVQFPEESELGIDAIVPNLSYLKGKEDKVRAIIITHAHNDHIGAIPYLMPLLPNVPIFSAPVTLAMVAKKLEYTPDVKINMTAVDNDSVLHLGNFTVSFIGVSHSIPSSLGVVIDTPCGTLVHTGDFKMDLDPQTSEAKLHFQQMQDLGSKQVLALLSDSTNASQSGHQIMEREVESDLGKIFDHAAGRVIVGMISTNIIRLGQMIKLAEQHGRHVVIGGLSLKTNFEIAEQLGFIQCLPDTVIDGKKAMSMSPSQLMIVCPGAQGETNGAFTRLADGIHRDFTVLPGDTIVFSSSVIPGNERSVQFITDKFHRLGAKVLNYKMLDIHAGGHARQDDLKEVVKMVKPKYLVPIEGHHSFLHAHADAAITVGMQRQNIFVADNGQIMEFDQERNGRLTTQYLDTSPVYVDGKTIGEVDKATLAERRRIGEEGMVVITFAWKNEDLYGLVNVKTFGFRKEDMLPRTAQNIALFVENQVRKLPKGVRANVPKWRGMIEERLAEELNENLGRQPHIVITVIPVK